jgi:hypothetical protein
MDAATDRGLYGGNLVSTDPVPAYFSFRYVLWLAWTNAITILMMAQAALTTLTVSGDIFAPTTERKILLAVAILGTVLAQIKRNGPPPMKPAKETPP